MSDQNLDHGNTVRYLIGDVISNKMDKSIVIRIERKVPHPLYNKYTKKTSKIVVHDENNQCNEGDRVKVGMTKPRSKNKSWELLEIVKKYSE